MTESGTHQFSPSPPPHVRLPGSRPNTEQDNFILGILEVALMEIGPGEILLYRYGMYNTRNVFLGIVIFRNTVRIMCNRMHHRVYDTRRRHAHPPIHPRDGPIISKLAVHVAGSVGFSTATQSADCFDTFGVPIGYTVVPALEGLDRSIGQYLVVYNMIQPRTNVSTGLMYLVYFKVHIYYTEYCILAPSVMWRNTSNFECRPKRPCGILYSQQYHIRLYTTNMSTFHHVYVIYGALGYGIWWYRRV